MDVLGTLPVRFHFNGEFIKSGSDLQYCGGNVAMAYIDRDKVSLPELVGHLKDHCVVLDGTLLHWLVPGKELKSGLELLWMTILALRWQIAQKNVALQMYLLRPQLHMINLNQAQKKIVIMKLS